MELLDLFRKSIKDKSSDLGQMYDYLKSRNSLPDVNVDPNMNSQDAGKYEPNSNSISLNPNYPTMIYGAANHETNHAVLQAIGQHINDIPRGEHGRTNTENQLVDAWRKLLYVKSKVPFGTDDSYRTDPNEYLSFGTGNMNLKRGDEPTYPVRPHVDATAATESSILRELAMRAQNDPRKDENRAVMALRNLFGR